MIKMSASDAGRLGALASASTQRAKFDEKMAGYAALPNSCKCCQAALSYKKRGNLYCSRSCAARINNLVPKRIMSEQARERAVTAKARVTRVRPSKKIVSPRQPGTGHLAMKKRLLSMFGNSCSDPECAWDFDACPVDVELDHMDGDGTNNLLSNLRLLCPNCHSLTDTFMGKNKGKSTRTYRTQRYAEGKSF